MELVALSIVALVETSEGIDTQQLVAAHQISEQVELLSTFSEANLRQLQKVLLM